LLVVCTVIWVTGTGCRFTLPDRKMQPTIYKEDEIGVTYDQARLGMRALVDPLCGEIEQAADQIIAGTNDPAIKRGGLLWKIEAVPALREALFQPDPFTAVMDAWVFCYQMMEYFEVGPGREALGDSAAIAVDTGRRMEEQIARVSASMTVSGDVSKARAFAKEWAAEHPMRHSISARETTLSTVLDPDGPGPFATAGAVMEVTGTMDDLSRRMEVYTDQVVRQARWAAELFKADLLGGIDLGGAMPLAERVVKSAEQAVATADRLGPAMERAVGVASEVPALVTSEREAVFTALQDEVTRVTTFIRQERVAALEHLTMERRAAFQELEQTLARERAALTAEMEPFSLKVIDHALWRVAQLAAAVLLGFLVVMIVGLLLARRAFMRTERASNQVHAE
jgi:hypothetical protein